LVSTCQVASSIAAAAITATISAVSSTVRSAGTLGYCLLCWDQRNPCSLARPHHIGGDPANQAVWVCSVTRSTPADSPRKPAPTDPPSTGPDLSRYLLKLPHPNESGPTYLIAHRVLVHAQRCGGEGEGHARTASGAPNFFKQGGECPSPYICI
jgi:hypothetical protein